MEAQGPVRNFLENRARNTLRDIMVKEGNNAAEVDDVLNDLVDEDSPHPILDLFFKYGLPFLIQLLTNLLAAKKMLQGPAPTPVA